MSNNRNHFTRTTRSWSLAWRVIHDHCLYPLAGFAPPKFVWRTTSRYRYSQGRKRTSAVASRRLLDQSESKGHLSPTSFSVAVCGRYGRGPMVASAIGKGNGSVGGSPGVTGMSLLIACWLTCSMVSWMWSLKTLAASCAETAFCQSATNLAGIGCSSGRSDLHDHCP